MNRRITRKDQERFSNGDCLILAQELHKATGWPLYALHFGHRDPDVHAFVLAPGKIAVDIMGARPVRQLMKQWENHFPDIRGYMRCDRLIDGWGWEDDYGPDRESYPGSRRRARQLVPFLIKQVAQASPK